MAAQVKGDAVMHDLVLWVPVRHGLFGGWGGEAEAPECPEGMVMVQQIAAVLSRKVADEIRRTLREGYKPMVSLKGRKGPGVG